MDLKSIHQIFTNRILRIPSYQRGYSWANNKPATTAKLGELKNIKGQLMDLWNDIINIPTDTWHYTGLLTLVRSQTHEYPWLKNHQQFSIVDGQQRITSILILISVLVEQANQLGIELGDRDGDTKFQFLYIERDSLNAYVFGYDEDNPSDKFFRKHILGIDDIEDDSRESVYTENLKKSKAFFAAMVHTYLEDFDSKAEGLQTLFNLVTSSLRFNEYVLPPELDEYVVFETMNNRGKPLSELEKLKNRLMYLSDKFETKAEERQETSEAFSAAQKKDLCESINKAWITIYQALGANKTSPLADDEFIKGHWIAYFDRYNRAEANAHATHLFNEYFTIEQVYDGSLTPTDIREYVKSLQRSAVVWNKIHNPSFFDASENKLQEAILGLHRVGFRASFKPIVLAALLQKNCDEFIPLINLLETYAFKVFYLTYRQSNTGDSKLYRLASRVYHSKLSAEEVCSEVKDYINYYYAFSWFGSQMEKLFDSGNHRGFYGWDGLHYFLYEYDQHLRKANQVTTQSSSLVWEDFNTKNTIEHIYPQSAAQSPAQFCKDNDTAECLKRYEDLQENWSAFSEYSLEQRKRLCNSLGNLLAISHSDNASFSNDRFIYKVDQSNKGDTYRNRGYRYDSMSAQIVAINDTWTPESIKNRGILMLKSMLAMLDEPDDLLDESELLKLLGLEFMGPPLQN